MAGKTIITFITNGGYGLGHSLADLKEICPDSKIAECIEISFDIDRMRLSFEKIDRQLDKASSKK